MRPHPTPTTPARRWAKFGMRVVASAALLAVVLSFVDIEQARNAILRVSPGAWIGAFAAFVALHIVSALKWRFYASIAGADIPRGHAFRCHAAGLFGNLCLPSMIGGDILRAGLAMRGSKARGAVVVASVVDRISDFTALLALSLLALPFAGVTGTTPLRALPVAAAALVGGGVAGVVTLRWVVRSRLVRRLPRKLARVVLEVAGALRTMRRNPGRSLAGWCASVAIQSGFLLANMGLGASMEIGLSLAQWFLLWPLAKIVSMLPISLGGLGVREAAFKVLVEPFGNGDHAVSVSLAWQVIVVAGGLLGGALWFASGTTALPRTAEA